jgi:hypothetical protein
MNISTRTLFLGAIAPIVLGSPAALAQSYDTQIDSKSSNAGVDSLVIFDSAGVLLGDYNPETNPEGTQTRPGIFGGSGNQPIDTSTTLEANTLLDTSPSGGFVLTPDFDLGTIEIDGLNIDLLNGQPGGTDLSITMLYQSFHTVSPSFVYPGGIPITLPLGEIGGINEALLTQTAPGVGTLSPTDDPAVFDLAMVVPAQLDMAVSQSLPGSDPTDTPVSVPIALPMIGQLTVNENGTITVSVGINPEPVSVETPIEGVSLPDIPFELPTFGAETASVIFSLSPELLSIDAQIDLTLNATGTKGACIADLNGDGELNFFDVSAFLSAFSVMDPAADFTGDGEYNFFDVSAFLSAFTDGCP